MTPGANADYFSPSLRLTLSSPVHPDAPHDFHFASRRLAPQGNIPAASQEYSTSSSSRPPVAAGEVQATSSQAAGVQAAPARGRPRGHGPDWYSCTVEWATSVDGSQVPMTVAHPVGVPRDGSSPCLLVVYGAYGHCLPTDFYPERVALLQVGGGALLW